MKSGRERIGSLSGGQLSFLVMCLIRGRKNPEFCQPASVTALPAMPGRLWSPRHDSSGPAADTGAVVLNLPAFLPIFF